MSFDLQPKLVGERLKLRPLQESDLNELFAVASDPAIWELHPAKERATREGFEQFFAESLRSGGALIIEEIESDKVIGSSRYHAYAQETSSVEIGWTFLATAFWGGAYNRELKTLMLEHAHRFVEKVHLVVHAGNTRSHRAMLKIGGMLIDVRADPEGPDRFTYEIRRH